MAQAGRRVFGARRHDERELESELHSVLPDPCNLLSLALLRTVSQPDLPAWIGDVEMTGVRTFGRPWTVRLTDGGVTVGPT